MLFRSPSSLKKGDKKILRVFLEEEWRAKNKRELLVPRGENFNEPFVTRIESDIKAALAGGEIPSIVVDLDDTFFLNSGRDLKILQLFDEVYGTKYFVHLTAAEIPARNMSMFLWNYLGKMIKNILNYWAD